MAEGHAVIRWARRLAPLVGEPLVRVQMPRRWGARPDGLAGQHVTDVETRGKHLLTHLSGGETLHTHGAQYGSWQVGEAGMALRKEEKHVRLRLLTAVHEAVFFHGPTVELLTPAELAAHERLNALGPDVMAEGFDRAEAARRVRAYDGPLGAALLDQRVVAGVGNIYKSEGLFVARLDPRRPAASATDAELDRLWDGLTPLMWAGTERYGRTLTTPPQLQAEGHERWVYGRKGRPCLVCGAPIEKTPQPPHDRATYFCPLCQR